MAHNYKVTTKVWVLIYLCDVTKALHLELVEKYFGPALVSALKQVFAICNMPSQITMEPGRNFVWVRWWDLKEPEGGSTDCLSTNQVDSSSPRISLETWRGRSHGEAAQALSLVSAFEPTECHRSQMHDPGDCCDCQQLTTGKGS